MSITYFSVRCNKIGYSNDEKSLFIHRMNNYCILYRKLRIREALM